MRAIIQFKIIARSRRRLRHYLVDYHVIGRDRIRIANLDRLRRQSVISQIIEIRKRQRIIYIRQKIPIDTDIHPAQSIAVSLKERKRDTFIIDRNFRRDIDGIHRLREIDTERIATILRHQGVETRRRARVDIRGADTIGKARSSA